MTKRENFAASIPKGFEDSFPSSGLGTRLGGMLRIPGGGVCGSAFRITGEPRDARALPEIHPRTLPPARRPATAGPIAFRSRSFGTRTKSACAWSRFRGGIVPPPPRHRRSDALQSANPRRRLGSPPPPYFRAQSPRNFRVIRHSRPFPNSHLQHPSRKAR
jgi:hypothetical protein